MITSKVVEKFESKDPHKIWEATWEILRCNDLKQLQELKKYIPKFEELISKVDLGGGLRKNEDDTRLALSYISEICNGRCRCYIYSFLNLISPEREKDLEFVEIENSIVYKELYETHYEVICLKCSTKYKVKEIIGWHVPVYEWTKDP